MNSKDKGIGEITGHILLVEDDVLIRQTLDKTFTEAGYRVTIAENGAQALSHLLPVLKGIYYFDLIIMDIQMPVLSGTEVREWIDSVDITIPMVTISANKDLLYSLPRRKRGSDIRVAKPFDPHSLLPLVNGILLETKQAENNT